MYFYLEYDGPMVVNDDPKLITTLSSVQLWAVTMGRKFSLSRRVKNYERKKQALKKRPPGRPRKVQVPPQTQPQFQQQQPQVNLEVSKE